MKGEGQQINSLEDLNPHDRPCKQERDQNQFLNSHPNPIPTLNPNPKSSPLH